MLGRRRCLAGSSTPSNGDLLLRSGPLRWWPVQSEVRPHESRALAAGCSALDCRPVCLVVRDDRFRVLGASLLSPGLSCFRHMRRPVVSGCTDGCTMPGRGPGCRGRGGAAVACRPTANRRVAWCSFGSGAAVAVLLAYWLGSSATWPLLAALCAGAVATVRFGHRRT